MELSLTWGDLWIKIQAFFAWLWSFPEVKFMIAHILVNFIVALAATIKTGEFVLARIGEFLYKKILPYVLVYAVFRIAGTAINMGGVSLVVWGIIELTLLGDLADNLSKLGIKIPEQLTKRGQEPRPPEN